MKAESLLTGVLALPLLLATLPAQTTYDLFIKDFSQALKFNSDKRMQQAIRSRPQDAIKHFEALLLQWRRKPEANDTRLVLDKIKELFKAAFEVETLDHLERYYTHIDQDRHLQLNKAANSQSKLHRDWLDLKQAQDRKGILEMVDQGLELGRHMEELGHKLNAADVYGRVAHYLNTIPKHQLQDTKDTIDVARMFMSMRDAWEWNKDATYTGWANWVKQQAINIKVEEKESTKRKEAGLKDSAEGLGKFVDPKATALQGKLQFKPLKALPPDSFFMGGIVPVNWMNTQVQAVPAKLAWFKKRELYLVRTSGTKIGVALTAEIGGKFQSVKAAAKVKPSVFYLGPKKTHPYSMAFFIGGEEPFAATTSNLSPTKDNLYVYYRSTSSWVAKVGDFDLTFFDDNCDGVLFTEDPLAFGLKTRLMGTGPKDEVPIVSYDSMQVGRRGPVLPFSSCVKLGEIWYLLASPDHGVSVEAKPMHPEFFKTGTVTMKWSGAKNMKPQVLIIRGRDNMQSASFSIASGNPVEVPVGTYDIVYGRASKGRGARTQLVHVFQGDSEPIKVEAGKNFDVSIGAPFRYDFVRGGTGDEVELDSLQFRIKGVFGLVYGKVHGPVPGPEVLVTRSNGGRPKVVGVYVPIASPDILNTAADTLNNALKRKSIRGMGINVGFFPVVKGDRKASTVFKFSSPYPGGKVGLRVSKHKLFGKIEPIFK